MKPEFTISTVSRNNHARIGGRNFALVFCLTGMMLGFLAGCGGPPHEEIELAPWKTHFGIQLPYPNYIPPNPPQPDTVRPIDGFLQVVPIEVAIDSTGNVMSVRSWRGTDSILVWEYKDFLTQIRFQPGVRDSMRAGFRLPAIFRTIGGGAPVVEVTFPLQRNRGIADPDLYWLAMEMNGVSLPSIARFPPYFHRVDESDSSPTYPIVVFKVAIDESGELTAVDNIVSTAPATTMLLESAAKWASYTPLEIAGKPAACTAYLAIALVRELSYPTPPYPPKDDSLLQVHYYRVRLLPDTTEVMFKPITTRPLSRNVTSALADSLWVDHYAMAVAIDTAGFYRYDRVFPNHLIERDSHSFRSTLRRVFQHVKFAPAMNCFGQTLPFAGYMRASCLDHSTVGLAFDWDIRSLFADQDSLASDSRLSEAR